MGKCCPVSTDFLNEIFEKFYFLLPPFGVLSSNHHYERLIFVHGLIFVCVYPVICFLSFCKFCSGIMYKIRRWFIQQYAFTFMYFLLFPLHCHSIKQRSNRRVGANHYQYFKLYLCHNSSLERKYTISNLFEIKFNIA